MSAALVLPFGPTLYLLGPGREPAAGFRVGSGRTLARPSVALAPEAVPAGLLRALSELGPEVEVRAAGPEVVRALEARAGRPIRPAVAADWQRGRRALPLPDPAEERAYVREVARGDLARALRSPAELLITLAREEERLERAVGREQRAAEAMIAVPASPLVEYAERWGATRAVVERHHRALIETLEGAAREVVPNLSAVVGPRVAARLVAAAGGVAALGRMRAGRLQLLGARRRPSPERGPRFGVIYRAERMADVPVDRRAAYARSLAALAAIAVRADASTRAAIAAPLVRRRDRRIEELRRRRR